MSTAILADRFSEIDLAYSISPNRSARIDSPNRFSRNRWISWYSVFRAPPGGVYKLCRLVPRTKVGMSVAAHFHLTRTHMGCYSCQYSDYRGGLYLPRQNNQAGASAVPITGPRRLPRQTSASLRASIPNCRGRHAGSLASRAGA